MSQPTEDCQLSQIVYSCYHSRIREGEQFVAEHGLSYQIAGTLFLNDSVREYAFKPGDFSFSKRNKLVKFHKQPTENGDFKSISIYLDQQTLRNFCVEFGYEAASHRSENVVVTLKPHTLLSSYIDSLLLFRNFRHPLVNN